MKIAKINASGFTLVEILVTVAIFSVIMLTLFSSLRIFLTSVHIIKQEVDNIEKTISSFKQITTDLQMIFITHPPRYSKPGFDSEPDQYRFEGQESELSFASLCHVKYNNDQIDSIVRIVYYLRPGKNHNRFDLCRKQMLQPYLNVEQSCIDPVLVTDVSNIEISYVDHEGEVYDSWDSESSEFEYSFPAAVNFVIKLYDENKDDDDDDKERKVETSISLPVKRMPI
ncbi:MAG: prepilin-type N-terminal cleavage/methylation domain-containing protein [Desulfobacteraceae bacterium]|nr:prepilin-type N-terminal cleavage/methylation domain-containing protein [Desulfobacteraceae bacterium]